MDSILSYLINEQKQKPETAARIIKPLEQHDDIRAELSAWIEAREYPANNPLTIEGYTAKTIAGLAPFMDGVGVYNFMVTLRERPDNARRIIESGFKRK